MYTQYYTTIMCIKLIIVNENLPVSITSSGTAIAGETYTLECYALIWSNTHHVSITWLDPVNNTVPSEMVSTFGSMSTLTFSQLRASDTGTYTCETSTGNEVNHASIRVMVEGKIKIKCML